jgi:hypothetical protein
MNVLVIECPISSFRRILMQRLLLVLLLAGLAAGCASAGEKKLMHCFAFTAIDSASPADWEAFFKATDDLPGTIPGLARVWYGKLRRPVALVTPADAASHKKAVAAGAGEEVTIPVRRVEQRWGVCMEMADEAALKTYAGHPAHKAWEQIYGKVRQPGTTSFDILGQ